MNFPNYDLTKVDDVERFKKNALKAVGLTNHPDADQIFVEAVERGHAGGVDEILHHLNDMSRMVLEEE